MTNVFVDLRKHTAVNMQRGLVQEVHIVSFKSIYSMIYIQNKITHIPTAGLHSF